MLPVRLRGARTHNLRGVDLELAPGVFLALTGPSGSGKSSLALDTLYAEGQRRFVESFSPYARQFLERLERPPIDSLDPVAATVAVDRRAPVKSSRSTLATMADLEAYLAGLFAREALPTCAECGVLAEVASASEAATRIATEWEGARAVLSYSLRALAAHEFLEIRDGLARDGYRRLLVGGELRDIDAVRPSEVVAAHGAFDVVVDRISIGATATRRLQQALEVAWERGGGRADLRAERGPVSEGAFAKVAAVPIARGLACPKCARTFAPPHPGLFSYNSPLGACEECRGFGRVISIDWEKVFPDPKKTLAKGAIRPWSGDSSEWERTVLARFAKKKKVPMDVPWGLLTDAQRALVIDGEGTWTGGKYPGVRAWFRWLEGRTYKMHVRVLLARYREYLPCPSCKTSRLNGTALSYEVAGKNLAEWHALPVKDAHAAVSRLLPRDPQGRYLQAELESRLGYLEKVGLGYLTLDRQARTLSGGEAQRAGLTTALGARLTGTMFVLDEPTVGLHPSDIPALGQTMRELSRTGNTVIVVEHDEGIVRSADRVIELGPGAGKEGGTFVFDGTPEELRGREDTPTGRAWRSRPEARTPRRSTQELLVRGARAHNLRGIDVRIPLGVICALTGPSGSGKSTLAEDILYRALARALGDLTVDRPGAHDSITSGTPPLRVVLVDQAPLGRTARGNAATYTKAWSRIRALFAAEPDAKRRGLTAAHFSFNVGESKGRTKGGGPPSGRCEACAGEGYETVEMQFLADVAILCPVCQGKRFRPEVLAVTHRGMNVADVLSLTVNEALLVFDPEQAHDPTLARALQPALRVGLGYLPLGQPLSTLSGGEAQRLKLARALSEPARRTLFILDEPSAGLHALDTSHVVSAMHALVDEGASVLVVEHDLDIIRAADWVIDLGPGGGPEGGFVVAEGTPSDLLKSPSKTGKALSESVLKRNPHPGPLPPAGEGERDSSCTTPLPEEGEGQGVRESPPTAIVVERAREHNLKSVACSIPHGKVTVVTGPSGSGKSSLAFDVIFAEGQRRFAETLTPYARQFLPTLPRPDVDAVTGVPPSIALEQRTSRAGANSTVATVTEVAHYLRLLFAKVGETSCPSCGARVAPSSAEEVFQRVSKRPTDVPLTLYAPAVRSRKGTYLDVFTMAARAGLNAARVDGSIVAVDPPPRLLKSKEHSIDLIVYYGPPSRLDKGTVDRALAWGDGSVRVCQGPPGPLVTAREEVLSTSRSCTRCGTGVPELDPRLFSFNTRQGQCEACEGTGVRPDAAESGDHTPCPACEGTRLARLPRLVKVLGTTYPEFLAHDVSSALALARGWKFIGTDRVIAKAPFAELLRRLAFVAKVGLGYLALDRWARTLSGGEMQRLRLSAQLGSGLTGALYVLDEPTIGLHPRDTRVLISNLRALADTGSTVLVVEHDAEVIRAGDYVVDLGPGGGREGGNVMAAGSADDVLHDPRSPTARALADATVPRQSAASLERWTRPPAWIELSGAGAHNLKNVTFRVPTARLVVVAGVSGSGKSTLVRHVFYPALRRALGLVAEEPGAHRSIRVGSTVRRALAVDQSPIGRTPRSVPATFLGIWDEIRKLFASLPDARARGYGPARFSFNATAGGRCTACEGQGSVISEMAFLPEVVSLCEACRGARFEPATLDVRYSGLSVADVLHLTSEEAAVVFSVHPKIARPLETLRDLGVGYIEIGQGSNTLSGGEAQRLKLAAELTAKSAHEPTVYVLDEPTTGLHIRDVRRLIDVMDRLVSRGDTLVVIEHHPDVIASADWVIELGPGAGAAGGHVVFEGDPRALAKANTPTGSYFASKKSRAIDPRDSLTPCPSPSSRRGGLQARGRILPLPTGGRGLG
jgi:excinuclease ABC subunit A